MGFIIKPVVTEKMNAVTEKSSVDKTIVARNEKAAKAHNATAETRSYIVKNKRHADGLKKKRQFILMLSLLSQNMVSSLNQRLISLKLRMKLKNCTMLQ